MAAFAPALNGRVGRGPLRCARWDLPLAQTEGGALPYPARCQRSFPAGAFCGWAVFSLPPPASPQNALLSGGIFPTACWACLQARPRILRRREFLLAELKPCGFGRLCIKGTVRMRIGSRCALTVSTADSLCRLLLYEFPRIPCATLIWLCACGRSRCGCVKQQPTGAFRPRNRVRNTVPSRGGQLTGGKLLDVRPARGTESVT
jgi:hypothetical protein